MRIVFMGTPDFAGPCLKSLAEKHEVVGVFTQPDKPKGRKMIMTPPPIKVIAEELNIPVFQPVSVKNEESLKILKELNPDLIAVVAYGKILPIEILDLPKYKCVNVHASLLPRHRGASPIQWAIVCGDKETGVTTQLMAEGIDTGDILLQRKCEIYDTDNSQLLHDRLSNIGADVLIETIDGLLDGSIVPVPQQEDGANYAPIIKKEMAQIDFNNSADEIISKIHGFNPWPCAYFGLCGKRIKVYNAIKSEATGESGVVLESNGRLIIGCGDTSVELTDIQPEGSKRMSAADMLRGKHIEIGTHIEVI